MTRAWVAVLVTSSILLAGCAGWTLSGRPAPAPEIHFEHAAHAGEPRPDETVKAGTADLVFEVVDLDGHPVGGVTIVATSPALQGTESDESDGEGHAHLRLLPPGTYALTFYYGSITFRLSAVEVVGAHTTPVGVRIDLRYPSYGDETGGASVATKRTTSRTP
jgi:hypothetical protein